MILRNGLMKKFSHRFKAIKCLSNAAEFEPHLVNVSLTKSLQNEWGYIQRVIMSVEKPFSLLKDALVSSFIPSLFGAQITEIEASLIMVSGHNGGLGIRDSFLKLILLLILL